MFTQDCARRAAGQCIFHCAPRSAIYFVVLVAHISFIYSVPTLYDNRHPNIIIEIDTRVPLALNIRYRRETSASTSKEPPPFLSPSPLDAKVQLQSHRRHGRLTRRTSLVGSSLDDSRVGLSTPKGRFRGVATCRSAGRICVIVPRSRMLYMP